MGRLIQRDRGIFRAAIEGMANRGRGIGLRQRRQFGELVADSAMCDMLYDEIMARGAAESLGEWEPDGSFLDRLEKWAKLVWEKREEILELIMKILAMFGLTFV